MAFISSLGVGSGLDIGSLVSDLVTAERKPATDRLDGQQAGYEAKLSAFGRLQGALADFQASVQKLNSLSDFQARSATSDNTGLLTATALKTATTGNYSIEVVRLAQEHKLASLMQDADALIGGSVGDALNIGVGTDVLSIDLSGGMDLDAIRDAINGAEANPGVTASIITGDNGQQGLVLTAAESGYENRVQLSFGGTTVESALGMSTTNLDTAGDLLTDLQDLDSEIVVDGYTVNRSGNTIADVIGGVTLDLVAAEPGSKVALSVAQDTDPASGAISGMVESYNALAAIFDEIGNYDPVNGEHGALLGDATLRSVQGRLQRELGSSVSGLSGAVTSLSGIGITTAADGSLELDSAKLNQFIEDGFENLGLMFAGENGIASRLERTLSAYAGAGGIVTTRSDGIQSSLDDIAEQRETLDRRLQSVEQRYVAQFSAMDALVSQLTATSDFLTQQLDALPGFTFSKQK